MSSERPKKILFFTENYERGGGNRYLFDLASMAAKNNNVTLYANCFGLELAEEKWFEDLSIPYHPVSILSWGELRARFSLRKNFLKKLAARSVFLPLSPLVWVYQLCFFVRILRQEKPDLVVACNGGYPAGGAVNRFLWASSWLGIPSYNSIVNIPSTESWDQVRMFFWDLIVPKICCKYIVDSKEIREQLLGHNFPREKFTIVYNGLKGTHLYTPRNNPRVKVLFFARLEPIKGIGLFLEAIRKCNAELSEAFEVHLYGAGTYTEEVKNLASEYPQNVFYHGFFEGDFRPIFQESDLYVLPSEMEGLPYTVLEAMRAGCCILATNVGGLPELVENGHSGVLIPSQKIEDLVSALEKLIRNRELRERLGRAAKTKFDAEFEQDSIFEIHSDLFNA